MDFLGYRKTPYIFINGTFYLKDYSIQLLANCNPTLQLTFLNTRTIIKIRVLN